MKLVTFHDTEVSIKDCYVGRVVAIADISDKNDTSKYEYGHIIGMEDMAYGLLLSVKCGPEKIRVVNVANCLIEDF